MQGFFVLYLGSKEIMVLIQVILNSIEAFAPPALQEGYDNAGMQCGNSKLEATGALLCLDITHAVI